MKRLIVLFTIVSFLSFGDSFAQANQGGFRFLVHIPTPIGEFGERLGIKTGLGFGIEYTYPIAPGLSWVTSTSLLLNSGDNSDYKKGWIGMMGPPTIIKGRYYNTPILTGFKFHGLTPRTISGYGMIQIGLNFFFQPTNFSGKTAETSFGFGIGGGLVFYNKYNVGIRFYCLNNYLHLYMSLVTFGIKL